MWIDIVAAVLVLAFAATGWRAGAAHQLVSLGELGAAFGLGLVLGYPAALFYYGKVTGSTALGAVVLWFVIVTAAAWIAAILLSKRFLSDIRYLDPLRPLHLRAIGALVGALRGALFVFIVLIILVARIWDGAGPRIPYQESFAGRIAHQHNPLLTNGKRLAERQGEFLDLDKSHQFENAGDGSNVGY